MPKTPQEATTSKLLHNSGIEGFIWSDSYKMHLSAARKPDLSYMQFALNTFSPYSDKGNTTCSKWPLLGGATHRPG